jgi:TonB-linked SusC/RagA family outer membrane protein
MKKNKFHEPKFRYLKKLLLTMKICLFFLLISVATVSASVSYSQNTRLTLNLQNATMKELIKEIENQSEFIFVFYDNAVNLKQKVSIRASDQPVEKILERVLESTGNTYAIFDRQIVIGKKNPETGKISVPTETASEIEQRKEITGKVTDSQKGPVPGVSVVIKGTTQGTITDENGNFRLSYVGEAKILSFSFVGMKTQEIEVGNKTNFAVVMEDETVGVGEVVVVAYGAQKRATVTGAVASMKNAELMQSPQANISNALVGRLSGLLSVQRSGQPGSDQSVLRIRGIGTFTGSQDPLIMVDGIETDNYNNIDPNEIENISILKDASATAVYGVRGANGVIIITTKRGTDGKPQVSYSSQYATSRFTDIRHSMNAYDYATNFNLAKRYDSYSTGGYTPAFTDEAIAKYKSGEDPIFYPDVDWFPYMFDKNSGQTQHNVNINGGTDKVKYFVSLGYFDQEGLINHTDLIKDYDAQLVYKRYNIRGNFDFDITQRLTANVSLSTQIENRSGSAADIMRVFDACWTGNPVDRPLITDGKYLILDGQVSNGGNPLAYLFGSGYQKNYRNYLNSSVRFNYKLDQITQGLTARATVSYNNFNTQNIIYSKVFVTYKPKRLADQSIVFVPQQDPQPFGFSETFGKNRKVYFEAGLDYARKFGVHNVSGLLLYNQSKRYDPDFLFLVPNGYQGLVGRATYDYKTRYLAEVNIGYNGTENFAPGKRFGFFPAYSLGWVASDEPFFPKSKYLSYMKIRGSYGVVGNDKLGDMLISSGTGKRFLYRPAAYSYINNFYQFGEDGANQQAYQGSIEGALGNPDLTWERAKKMNIGAEMIFLDDKLKVVVDYFDENRDDILASRNTVPGIVAATLPAYNMGKMSNSGYEVEVAYNNKIGKLDYWLKGNYTFAHNVIEFQDEVARTYSYQNRTGQRSNQYFGLVADGLFNTWEEVNDASRPVYEYQNNKIQPGDIRYVDVNGDGKINNDDMVPVGYSDFPEKVFGFSFGGNFKGFDFSVLFQGAANVSIAYTRNYVMPFLEGRNAPDYMVESWSQERLEKGLPINFPRFNQGYNINPANHAASSFWTQDASYVRLKNAEIGYSIPENLLKRVGINYLRLYVNANNLLTWDNMLPGVDPESAAASRTNYDPYPVTRTINMGFNVKF